MNFGTLREVINGINLKKNILGIIPAGTGNGFIRSCGIPLKSSDVIKFAGSDIYLKAVQKVPVHIDGDVFDLPEVNITIKPGVLRVLAPAQQMIR